MQKRKPVWNAPMLNQPTVFEAAHIEYIEINGFAAAYSLPRARIRTQILSPDSTYSSMLLCSPSTIPVSPYASSSRRFPCASLRCDRSSSGRSAPRSNLGAGRLRIVQHQHSSDGLGGDEADQPFGRVDDGHGRRRLFLQ